jgi:8-oxo-dGTP diphosphatase
MTHRVADPLRIGARIGTMTLEDEKCKCGNKMKLSACWDNAQQTDRDHAWNLYMCEACGRICKQDVWTNEGELWIGLDGLVEETAHDPSCAMGEDCDCARKQHTIDMMTEQQKGLVLCPDPVTGYDCKTVNALRGHVEALRAVKPMVGVSVLVIDPTQEGRRVLAGVRGPDSKRGAGAISIPGGALEHGEEIIEGAARELEEETGLILRGYTCVQYTEVVLDDTKEHWITFYVVAIAEPDKKPERREPGKCMGWAWIEWDALKESTGLFQPLQKLMETGWSPFGDPRFASYHDVMETLEELTNVVEGHVQDGDDLDSFTTQPARAILDRKVGACSGE